MNKRKVRVCFKCKVYVHIFPENAHNVLFVHEFDVDHEKHPVQTVSIDEVDKTYVALKEGAK